MVEAYAYSGESILRYLPDTCSYRLSWQTWMVQMTNVEMKLHNIYRAQWKVREWNDQKDHCFEGTFIVVERHGELRLVDTYWSINGSDSDARAWKAEEVESKFNIKYYCNLDEIEICPTAVTYYADEDVFVLTKQHACVPSCIYYFVKKGATRSKEKMLAVLRESIHNKNVEIRSAKYSIERMEETLRKVESGNLEVYI